MLQSLYSTIYPAAPTIKVHSCSRYCPALQPCPPGISRINLKQLWCPLMWTPLTGVEALEDAPPSDHPESSTPLTSSCQQQPSEGSVANKPAAAVKSVICWWRRVASDNDSQTVCFIYPQPQPAYG